MERTYKVGTRTSPLALRQVDEIVRALDSHYSGIKLAVIGIDTYGDQDKQKAISEIEGTDFFTREIDQALLKAEIDFAVHSAKDLADSLACGLAIAAITEIIDPFDVLVSKQGVQLHQLPYAARLGTSSARRKRQLKRYRSDFQIADIRGNIEERLKLLDGHESGVRSQESGNLDGIVIAAAGLLRLGLAQRISQRIPLEILKPHPLQGALAVVARAEDLSLLRMLSVLDEQGVACR